MIDRLVDKNNAISIQTRSKEKKYESNEQIIKPKE